MFDVSVIIPTWNRADVLVKAIQSALSQTLAPLEVLVCDDGSTDSSYKIVQDLNDSRIVWIPGQHSGLPAVPRNRGIARSKGNWIAFLDSDDEWLPEKLEKQLSLADKTGCMAVCCNAFRFVPGKGNEGDYVYWNKDRITLYDLLTVNHIICSSSLVHRTVFDSAHGFPENNNLKALEDYALWFRITMQTDFAFVDESLVVYADDVDNSIRADTQSYLDQKKAVLDDFVWWWFVASKRNRSNWKFLKVLPTYLYVSLAFTTRKIIIKNKSQELVAKEYVKQPALNCLEHINFAIEPLSNNAVIDIVTIAFNNELVIEHQERLIRKYILDDFRYTVADNSSDPKKRGIIRKLCMEKGVGYVSLPPDPYNGKNSSFSHGLALNWIYVNYITPRNTACFGFIDHDMFPVQPTRIVPYLEQSPVFGLIQEREDKWYLWPGFCFFLREFTENRTVNFLPGKNSDTGGSNWNSLYCRLDRQKIPTIKHEYGNLRDGIDPQSDLYEKIGDWVHTFNASNWKKVTPKDSIVQEFLADY
ncbi:MAG: glycosyltransferase family 2 protein [Desulfuromonadaceae bacterium]